MTERIPQELFVDQHYRGRPANIDNLIVGSCVNIVRKFSRFIDNKLSLINVGSDNGVSLLPLAPLFRDCLGIETPTA